jgi:hypothetical protein
VASRAISGRVANGLGPGESALCVESVPALAAAVFRLEGHAGSRDAHAV